jgi:hypothetical protein
MTEDCQDARGAGSEPPHSESESARLDKQDGLGPGVASSHSSSLQKDSVAANSNNYQEANSTQPIKRNTLLMALDKADRELRETRRRGKPLDTSMGEEPGEKRRRVYAARYENISCSRDRKFGQLGE